MGESSTLKLTIILFKKELRRGNYMPSGDQITDGFIKALQVWATKNFKYNLNLTKV
jgi:hypothetical protein